MESAPGAVCFGSCVWGLDSMILKVFSNLDDSVISWANSSTALGLGTPKLSSCCVLADPNSFWLPGVYSPPGLFFVSNPCVQGCSLIISNLWVIYLHNASLLLCDFSWNKWQYCMFNICSPFSTEPEQYNRIYLAFVHLLCRVLPPFSLTL